MSNTTQPGAVPSEEASSPAQQSPSSPAETPADTPASSPAAPTSAAEQPTSNPPASPTQNPPTQETSQAAPPPENTPSTPAEQPSSPAATSQPAEQPTSAAPAPTSAAEPPTSANDPSPSDESTQVLTTIVTVTPSDGTSPQTSIVLVTSTIVSNPNQPASTISSSASSTATPIGSSGDSGTGLSQKSKVAIGVVVPIAAIAILAIVGLFLWKKRRARQAAQEERRKEVEDYSYNPNADPTIPNVAMGAAGSYEMREDGSSGYRGWGTTTLGSTGRKASTTMSGGVGQAYSDATSPTMRGNMSDAPLMDGSYSPEGEILGAMGPSAANNRGADVHRGPSNASSSYSAAARSENSDGVGMTYGAGGTYYDQYAQNNPYNENAFNQAPPSQPIIRDNPARRNTRIESPSHYPQQSAGISQNF